MSDLKKKLKSEIDQCNWNLLDKNLERGAVFLVSENLNLEDVAHAIATDQAQSVSNWLKNEELTKLSIQDDQYKDSKFEYLIIQPYVIVKPIKLD